MQFLTDFADQAVVLPLAACLLAWAWLTGWRQGARAFAVALAATFGTIAALKLALASCDPNAALRSPSGHTASAALIYGGGAALLLRLRPPAGLALAAAAAAAIAATRLGLRVHTPADVLTGAAAGLLGTALLLRQAGPRPTASRLWPLLLTSLVCAAALHGRHLHIEQALRRIALGWLHAAGCL